ncbi:HAAS signaling domain-containing protein [Cellulomonas sp. Marseille-Q8402]
MNGTAPAQDGAVRVAVERYAADVRRHLGDLPPDQVDDLTDGLEADLADALTDGPAVAAAEGAAVDLTVRFGDPHAYAQELRAAAGLPDEGAAHARPWPDRVGRAGGAVAAAARRTSAVVRRQPWAAPIARAATDLRAIWWVLRGWIAYQALMWLVSETSWLWRLRPERDGVPGRALHWAVLLVLVVLSVQWGRGRWGAAQLPRLSRALTVGAVLLALPVAVFTSEARYYGAAVSDVRYVEVPGATIQPDDGVWVDGMQVSNLFVYDADGDPLQDVQVYDDRGRPVRATADEGLGSWSLPGVDEPWTFVPSHDEDGRERWNVYPLAGAPSSTFAFAGDGSDPEPGEDPRTPPRPFAKAPALVDVADDGPGSDAARTPAAEPTPSP